jgi:hypothetical protein
MTNDAHLKAWYADRATLALAIEHLPMGTTPATMERYAALQADLRAREVAYAQAWHRPCAETIALPWCSVCGNSQRPLLPGQTICDICDKNMAAGTMTPGAHAEAERTP